MRGSPEPKPIAPQSRERFGSPRVKREESGTRRGSARDACYNTDMLPFPSYDQLRDLIQLAKREDLGADDVTSRLLIDENAIGIGTILQKEVGIACGLPIVEMVCRTFDERLRVEPIPG